MLFMAIVDKSRRCIMHFVISSVQSHHILLNAYSKSINSKLDQHKFVMVNSTSIP